MFHQDSYIQLLSNFHEYYEIWKNINNQHFQKKSYQAQRRRQTKLVMEFTRPPGYIFGLMNLMNQLY